jgi:heme-degrading monooxygenase HmoA
MGGRVERTRGEAMIISIFGDTVTKPGMEEREALLDGPLEEALRAHPGFISYKTYVAHDGESIGLMRFETREALDAWVNLGTHGEAQAVAADIYESFWVQSAEVFRQYRWERGRRVDGDLTDLFIER